MFSGSVYGTSAQSVGTASSSLGNSSGDCIGGGEAPGNSWLFAAGPEYIFREYGLR